MRSSLLEHTTQAIDRQRVIPQLTRKGILMNSQRSSKNGKDKHAKLTLYWPSISSSIENTVSACAKCQEHRLSLQREPMKIDPDPSLVFEVVSSHYFSFGGRNFLVYVDWWWNWPVPDTMGRETGTVSPYYAQSNGQPRRISCQVNEETHRDYHWWRGHQLRRISSGFTGFPTYTSQKRLVSCSCQDRSI